MIHLVPYDPTWPLEFEAEAARIERACADLELRLEHIGSTAIPGLSAKPIIDILAGRPPRAAVAPYIAAMKQIGYEHKGAYGIPGRQYFRRGAPRSHHVHMVSWTSAFWREHLAFRDFLRDHPERAREYDALKRELAPVSGDDHAAYVKGKGPFVRAVLREAGLETA
jgi:GrpB-like predicted nucleotidyltransferase (UPF0157 family)